MFKRNLNRKALANTIHQNIGFSKIISENIVNDIFYIIISAFKENEKVKIASFGTFQIRRKNERIGRNPKTKEKKITKPPLNCPVCGSKTIKEKDEAVIRCTNTVRCDAQNLGGLIHFVSKKSLNIEGLGEKQINQ